jgi:hypothetical protein
MTNSSESPKLKLDERFGRVLDRRAATRVTACELAQSWRLADPPTG